MLTKTTDFCQIMIDFCIKNKVGGYYSKRCSTDFDWKNEEEELKKRKNGRNF